MSGALDQLRWTRESGAVALRCLAMLLLLSAGGLAGGCGDESDGSTPPGDGDSTSDDASGDATGDATDAEDCETHQDHFEDQVWASVAGAYCVTCHTDGGLAAQSNLVLERSVRPDYLEVNFERMEDMARLTRDGESVLILKPLGELNHGGGAVLQPDSEQIEVLRQFIARLDTEDACEVPNVEDLWEGVVLEPAHLTVRRASLLLLGRLPTDGELAPAREHGENGLAESLDLLMQDPAFADRIAEIYRDIFWTNHYLGGNRANGAIDGTTFPNRRWYENIAEDDGQRTYRDRTNRALALQPVELVRYVVAEGRPLSEILTADYVMVNDYSAVSMGLSRGTPDLDDPATEAFRPAQIHAQPVAGVVALPVFLHRFPTTATNRNRHRAFIFYDRFLATDILALADRPIDATLTEAHNPTLNDYQCTNCHTVMDPVAGLFQNWNNNGAFRIPEDGWFQDLAPPGFEGVALPASERSNAVRWLTERAVDDPRFALATVNTLYEGLLGRAPARTVDGARTDEAALERRVYRLQRSTLFPITDAFVESGFDVRVAVRELLQTPWFRAVATEEHASPEVAHSAGRRELLGPDDLNRKLTAVTGYPWAQNATSNPFLLNNYYLLYGGLDWNVAVSRLSEPNGIMNNIAERAAAQHACSVVPRDFSKQPGDRILVPHVERSFVPITPEGFEIPDAMQAIRENIQHLHARILGEELPLDHPEIDATMDLFLEVWSAGFEDRQEDRAPRDLPNACRSNNDFWTGESLPDDQRIVRDEDYTVRAWIAVVAYLLSDFRFLYE